MMVGQKAARTQIATELLDILPSLIRRLHSNMRTISETPDDTDELQELADLRATPSQIRLLGILVRQEHETMQALATHLAVTPAAITTMVKRLLAQNYVERQRDEQDWRLVWVTPTDRGRRVIQLYKEVRQTSLENQLARLSPEEHEQLLQALPALRHLLELYP
jgi:DNA-binding MarR family transcriptional regulator